MGKRLKYYKAGGCLRSGKCFLVFTLGVSCFYAAFNTLTIPSIQSYDSKNFRVKISPQATLSPFDIETKFEIQFRKFSNVTYKEALTHQSLSSKDNIIVLALFDSGCYDVALNFYLTSLKKFNISNYLLISSDTASCDKMWSNGIACYLYKKDVDADKASLLKSKDFLRKMTIRTCMILEALQMGFNVLHTDVDVVFFKNPLHDIVLHTDCHVSALWDNNGCNAGFLFVKSSKEAIALYECMKETSLQSPLTDDQAALNKCIRYGMNHHLVAKILPQNKYQNGFRFWESGKRTFVGDNPCDSCIVIHNNWIVSMEAKIYRFKEMGLWMNDIGKYYSDLNRKYIVFGNPIMDPGADLLSLRNALAIGRILNRVVILPAFHCGKHNNIPCSIISYLKLRSFEKVFNKDMYREHTFLSHPLVPKEVINSQTEHFIIYTTEGSILNVTNWDNIFYPLNPEKGATEDEIRKWFVTRKEAVLNFHSLNRIFCCFNNDTYNELFEQMIYNAFTKGGYRQR